MPITLTPFLPTLPRPETSSPTPKIIPPTETETESSPTPESFATETPSPLPTINLIPTLTTTVIPQPSIDSGVIQLLGPGPLSKVLSPIVLYGYSLASISKNGRIDLFGEDGRLLATQQLFLDTTYKWAYYYWEVPFKTSAAAELGRLTISTQDQYGRINAAYSIHLLLLSEGDSIINPPGNLKERCVIEKPTMNQNNSGGLLTVAGKMRPFNDLPLTVELVARDRSIITAQSVPITASANDSYVPFQVDLNYSVSTGTWALLVVAQSDNRIGGTMYLYSREIFLNPGY